MTIKQQQPVNFKAKKPDKPLSAKNNNKQNISDKQKKKNLTKAILVLQKKLAVDPQLMKKIVMKNYRQQKRKIKLN